MSESAPVTSAPLTAQPALLDQWYAVAPASDIADHPVPVEVLGRRFVMWRDRAVVAAPDRCSHRQAPLSEGFVEEGCLVCPYHGWRFASSGDCVRIPSAPPGVPVPPAAHLSTVPVRELHGLIWMSPGQPVGDPPSIPEDGDASFRRINVGSQHWSVSATRMIDNFCDVAHFPFVHAGTLGVGVDEVVDAIHVEDLDGAAGHGFTGYRYEVDVDDATGERVRQRMTTAFHLPFTVRSTTRIETGPDAGSERVLLLCTTPIDDDNSSFTFVVWRNGDAGPTDEEQIAFDRAVGAEDRAMLERIPGALPLEVSSTANVRSDRLSVEWRRRLVALLTGS